MKKEVHVNGQDMADLCHWFLTKHGSISLQLQSASVHFIAAKHTTPVKSYVEDINFRLVSYHFFACCHVSAMSISETWYAIKDHGTNYCNLYNLMEGSGLTEARGYKEVTSDFLCTQRSSANCTVY
ncbi:uncharacterized protein LOC123977753 [Micropterus dolomieu]|uniref:uncharacterized protein LOC123977753 n=1 Tax=Micropterus dolomieu TaxID=147949 RepID=UPI001E8D0D2B|nr:uncharacterized protein LOC123977753 [Micropterus dolomieu]